MWMMMEIFLNRIWIFPALKTMTPMKQLEKKMNRTTVTATQIQHKKSSTFVESFNFNILTHGCRSSFK